MKAIGTRRENRFRNAKEMQDALFAIGPDNIYAEESLVLTHPDVDFPSWTTSTASIARVSGAMLVQGPV